LVRSDDFWSVDGTVVLKIEQTHFHVHRGLLSARSTVFSHTFSIPQPAGESLDMIDRCPVIHLHETAKSFTRFLRALHHCGPL
ncbi:hypothetical protein C8J57DRAFT_1077167, partial [Mycena rebaudengoi]